MMFKIKQQLKEQKNGINEINNKFNILISMLSQNNNSIEINNKNININNPYADDNGNLANLKNPFYKEAVKNDGNKINIEDNLKDSDEEINLLTNLKKEKVKENKRGKYKDRDPVYYYYIIDGKEYKYTCRNKTTKSKYYFYCSDTPCKASGNYFIE